MRIELIVNILLISVASTFISTQLIQRIKENFKVNKWLSLAITSLIVSFTTGFLFTLTFTNLGIINALWVGLISYAGAEIIYQNFKDKLGLKSLTELKLNGGKK